MAAWVIKHAGDFRIAGRDELPQPLMKRQAGFALAKHSSAFV